MPAQLEVSDGECGGSRYDGSCWPCSVFNPCILSVLIVVLWHTLLMKIHGFSSFFWVWGTSRLHKQMNTIWYSPVIFGVPLPAPWAGCVFKSLESSARLFCQMSFLPGKFKWLRWLHRPNPNLKIIGVLMKCSLVINVRNNYSSSPTLSLGCQPLVPSVVVVGEYLVPAKSGLALKAFVLAVSD